MTDTPRQDIPPSLQNSVAQSRKEFVTAMASIRPRLHKFSTRMCGSPFDGEDVVQEVLADAFYNLSSLKDAAKFESWLFRIAYNKCIDFIRRSHARADEVALVDEHDAAATNFDDDAGAIPTDEALATLVGECFNQRDWAALGSLVRADARLEIVGEALGDMAVLGATYHTNYDRLPWQWQLSAGVVGSELVVVHWRERGAEWLPHSAIRLWWVEGKVVRIRDYIHVDYLLSLFPSALRT